MEKEKTPAISVIVPIYNVEKYIARCLESLAVQVYDDFEVVMINDGTQDSSAEIAAQFAAADSRFRLFHQENMGVGEARNRGVELARGQYISFVDADDMLFADGLQRLAEAAKKDNSDIVCCSYFCCDESGENLRKSHIMKREGVYRGDKILGCAIRDVTIRSYLWNKLWRRSLFVDNGIMFPNMYFEDSAMVPILFGFAGTVSVISDPLYIYTCRNNSITGLTSERCVGDYIAAHNLMESFYATRSRSGIANAILTARLKKSFVTFAWIFIRIFRAKTFTYSGRNFAKVVKFAVGYKGERRQREERKELAIEKAE